MAKRKGVVAAGHQLTVEAGAEILEEDGNAVDAVIAALMAATVTEPVFASPGGGGFAMIRQASSKDAGSNEVRLFDFFSQTPLRAPNGQSLDFEAIHADFGPAAQEFHIGAGSTAVPGFMEGLFALHERFGSLPFKRLAEPAIRYARRGIEVKPFQSYLFSVVTPILTHTKGARALFAPGGDLLKAGDSFKNPELADFYDCFTEEGIEFQRRGDFAQAIVKQSSDIGGLLSREDLTSYKVVERLPLSANYCGASVFLNPAPAASGLLIGFGFELLAKIIQRGEDQLTALLQTLKATVDIRSSGQLFDASSDYKGMALQELERISASPQSYRGTTHVSVIDGDENAASVTVSNGEGNGYLLDGCGFMLNNMLGEEDLNEQGFFAWPPNTRLSSMMAPTLIIDKDGGITALGSGGSNRIRSAVLQVSDHILRGGLSLEAAINDRPRVHIEKCGQISFEDFFDAEQRQRISEFQSSAHGWDNKNMFFGGVHGVSFAANEFTGAGDHRRDGCVVVV